MKIDTSSIMVIAFIALAGVAGYFWVSNKCRLTSTPPFTWCGGGSEMSLQEEADQSAMYANYY